MTEKFTQFLSWWYGQFPCERIARESQGYFKFIPEELYPALPKFFSTLLLIVVAACVLDLVTTLFCSNKTLEKMGLHGFKDLAFLYGLSILAGAVCLVALHFGREFVPMFVESFSLWDTCVEAIQEIPGYFTNPPVGKETMSYFEGALEILLCPIMILLTFISQIFTGIGTILCLTPWMILIGFNFWLYGFFRGILRSITAVGGGIFVIIGVLLAIYGVSLMIAPAILLGTGPILAQSFREDRFIRNGGSITRTWHFY